MSASISSLAHSFRTASLRHQKDDDAQLVAEIMADHVEQKYEQEGARVELKRVLFQSGEPYGLVSMGLNTMSTSLLLVLKPSLDYG